MSDAERQEFYFRNIDLLTNNSIIESVIRDTGWALIKLLVWITEACKALYDKTFGLVDFTSWPGINKFADKLTPFFMAIMVMSIFALGITLIFYHEKKPKIIVNICLAVLIVTSSTYLFSAFNGMVKDIKEGIEDISVKSESGETEDYSVYSLISKNLLDLIYIDSKIGFLNINYKEKGDKLNKKQLTEKDFWNINYSEVINYDNSIKWKGDRDETNKILKHKLMPFNDKEGRDVEVSDGVTLNAKKDSAPLGNEYYYRYKFSFFNPLMQLISLMIIYLAMSYKCVRIVFELAVARLFAFLYSAELSGGEKIGKILVFIRDSYILLLVTTLCIRVYYLMNAYVSATINNDFVEGVLMLFVAFSVIDGPNLVQKLLGLDAGLRSSTGRLMAMYGGFKAAGKGVKQAGKTAGKAYNHGKNQKNNRQENGKPYNSGQGASGNPYTPPKEPDDNTKKAGDMDKAYSGSQNDKTTQDKQEKKGRVYSGGSRNYDFMNNVKSDNTGSSGTGNIPKKANTDFMNKREDAKKKEQWREKSQNPIFEDFRKKGDKK